MESLDRISITINGAEVEAIDGMKTTLEKSKGLRLSIAGWYKRGRHRVGDIISAVLTGDGYNVAIGHEGGLLAWK